MTFPMQSVCRRLLQALAGSDLRAVTVLLLARQRVFQLLQGPDKPYNDCDTPEEPRIPAGWVQSMPHRPCRG